MKKMFSPTSLTFTMLLAVLPAAANADQLDSFLSDFEKVEAKHRPIPRHTPYQSNYEERQAIMDRMDRESRYDDLDYKIDQLRTENRQLSEQVDSLDRQPRRAYDNLDDRTRNYTLYGDERGPRSSVRQYKPLTPAKPIRSAVPGSW